MEDSAGKSIMIEIDGYNLMISAFEDSGNTAGRTSIMINVYGTGLSQG
jgi:hypothetical protein